MKLLHVLLLLTAVAHADTMLDAPAYLWTLGCGPTAAATLEGYWAEHGYSNLSPDIPDLAKLMGTVNGWTSLYQVAPALTAFGTEHGYGFDAYSTGFTPWATVTAELDKGDPLMALVDFNGDGVTDHFVPIIGYSGQNYCYYTTWSLTATCSPYVPMQAGQSWGVGYLTWLEPETPASVPEPATLLLLGVGLIALKVSKP